MRKALWPGVGSLQWSAPACGSAAPRQIHTWVNISVAILQNKPSGRLLLHEHTTVSEDKAAAFSTML